MKKLNAIAMMLIVCLVGAMSIQKLQAEERKKEIQSTDAFVKHYMTEALIRALEDSDVMLVVVEATEIGEAPPFEDGRSVDEIENYTEVRRSLTSGGLDTNLKFVRAVRGNENEFAERLFVPNVKSRSINMDYQTASFMPEIVSSRWLLFLESPFDEKTKRQASVMESFRELKAGTFLNRRNFFLHWVPQGISFDSVSDAQMKDLEAFICLNWPDKDELPDYMRSIWEESRWDIPPTLPLATEQLPDDIESILEVIDDPKRGLLDHAEELQAAVTDPYAEEALERMITRRRSREKAEAVLVKALTNFFENRDTTIALVTRHFPRDVHTIIKLMETWEDWEDLRGMVSGFYSKEYFEHLRMLELTDNLESEVRIIEALGKTLKGGRIVLPEMIENLPDGAKRILEVIEDEEKALRDYEEELRAEAGKSSRTQNMLRNLFERREQATEWIIEAFIVAIEDGLDFDFSVSETFEDDIKTILQTSVAGKPTLQDHAEELRDAVTDPYVLQAFECLLKRKQKTETDENPSDDSCGSCP